MSPRRKQPKLSESAWSKAIDAVRARENLASRSGKPSPDELQAEASADRRRDRINQVSPKKSRPGYTRKDGVYVPPVRSPKQDREHDDIARRDQASADRTPDPQFDYRHLRSPDYSKNSRRLKDDAYPCIICGRPCPDPKYMVWEHCGGGTVVTRAEGERLNAAGHGGADLGGQPIGADCLRKHPELRPYVTETGEQ